MWRKIFIDPPYESIRTEDKVSDAVFQDWVESIAKSDVNSHALVTLGADQAIFDFRLADMYPGRIIVAFRE